jgi:hypothetical protein
MGSDRARAMRALGSPVRSYTRCRYPRATAKSSGSARNCGAKCVTCWVGVSAWQSAASERRVPHSAWTAATQRSESGEDQAQTKASPVNHVQRERQGSHTCTPTWCMEARLVRISLESGCSCRALVRVTIASSSRLSMDSRTPRLDRPRTSSGFTASACRYSFSAWAVGNSGGRRGMQQIHRGLALAGLPGTSWTHEHVNALRLASQTLPGIQNMNLGTNLRELAHHMVARTQVDQDFHKVLRAGVAQSLSCTSKGRTERP